MIQDKTVFVQKVSSDGAGTDKETYVDYPVFLFQGNLCNAARMNIQPASAELTIMSGGEVFKVFKAFTTNSGIVESMRVTVSGTNDVYTVKGRERFDYGFLKHYELTLIKGGR
jgi:hypothetical protein